MGQDQKSDVGFVFWNKKKTSLCPLPPGTFGSISLFVRRLDPGSAGLSYATSRNHQQPRGNSDRFLTRTLKRLESTCSRVHRCPFWLFWQKIDGFRFLVYQLWFTSWFTHLPGKPIYFPQQDTYGTASFLGRNVTQRAGSLPGAHWAQGARAAAVSGEAAGGRGPAPAISLSLFLVHVAKGVRTLTFCQLMGFPY